jgi:hypothetical protein
MSKWLRYEHRISFKKTNYHYNHQTYKMAKSGATFLGQFVKLSALEPLCGCSFPLSSWAVIGI